MKLFSSARVGLLLLAVALVVSRSVDLTAGENDIPIAQAPLFIGGNQPPLMMLVMSRDEQLFNKAYSDYTDLNNDGVIDTTYQDTFNYSGYFDPKLCYDYAASQFKSTGAAGGPNTHTCSSGAGRWSGNFLNWATMSRLDVLRFVLYGGKRSTDTGTTVLERAHIPNDLHSWVKVYNQSNIGDFTPLSGTQSFCNTSTSLNGAPLMRIAAGSWSEWAATAITQCRINANSDTPPDAVDVTVRVQVCDASVARELRENFCSKYTSSTTESYKPTGLLQTYGETGRLRFGLISGSYGKPRSGGLLRRNIGKLAGNGTGTGCVPGDEIDLSTGRFCNQASGAEGIINTIDQFKLTQWSGSSWSDCNTYSILNRSGFGSQNLNNPGVSANQQNCSGWGNPLAEMYAEALRYIGGQLSPTSDFSGGNDLPGLPTSVSWVDPYRQLANGGNSYCAACSILVLASGLGSFDSDEIPTVPQVGDATTATNQLGSAEGISGNYFAGRVTATPLGAELNTHEDICKSFAVTQLGLVRGICPDSPSVEGSYLMSGLAYKAFTTDMRPGLQGKPSTYKNNVRTYTVALAENLPKFEIPLSGKTISLTPLCQANNTGTAVASSTGWRTCFLGSVGVGTKTSRVSPNHVYGRNTKYVNGNLVAASFSLVWEDSLWGNDHDNDVVSMLTYCIGAACNDDTNPKNSIGKDICWKATDSSVCTSANGSPLVGDDEVLVRIENLSAYAGNAMLTGFGITGSNSDGVKRIALRPGNTDGSLLTAVGDCTTTSNECKWYPPQVLKFKVGSGNTKLLESPLWYAAKYGGFNDLNGNGRPDTGEWDTKAAGAPDNYFLARDPTKLKDSLENIFEGAAGDNSPTGAGASGTRLNGDSFSIDTTFNVPDNSNDWTGNVVAKNLKPDGTFGTERWNAGNKLLTQSIRKIRTVIDPTILKADGSVKTPVVVKDFTAENLKLTTGTVVTKTMWPRNYLGLSMPTTGLLGVTVPPSDPLWLGNGTILSSPDTELVAYLRGDQSKEQRKGGIFRNRSLTLGDIINSTAEIVSPKDDYGYTAWAFDTSVSWKAPLAKSYDLYLKAKAAPPTKTTMYVGANDGMLHAFDASANGGNERFAFIPSVARERMGELANPAYTHRYSMDGAITTADIADSETGDWRTVLVASAGAGGRSVSAIDVTNPDAFDSSSVLWELRGTDTVSVAGRNGYDGDNDLGYVLGKPVVVPVTGESATSGPRWVALFGNGVDSVNGVPTLYVVDVTTKGKGQVLARLKPTDATIIGKNNGLMNIAPVALYNGTGVVDTVYGGDLNGNVWKFDLSANAISSWKVAYGGQPLFIAKDGKGKVQPITGGLEVSRGPGGGVSIFFGTGRYFAVGDNNVPANPDVQSLYSIQDRCVALPCANSNRITGDRALNLVEQTISKGDPSGTYQTRNVSQNSAGRMGWFIDLKVGNDAIGERFIGTPRLQNGKVFFTTFEPTGNDCAAGGLNWLYGLSLLSGGGAMSGVSTTPGGIPVCNDNCGGVSLGTGAPARDTSVLLPPPPTSSLTCPATDPNCSKIDSLTEALSLRQCTLVLRAPGAEPLYLPRPCGRQSWRQIR